MSGLFETQRHREHRGGSWHETPCPPYLCVSSNRTFVTHDFPNSFRANSAWPTPNEPYRRCANG
jgi:hypothetical protein